MKTLEELKALKEEVETLNKKLSELSEEELRRSPVALPPDFNNKPGREEPVIPGQQ